MWSLSASLNKGAVQTSGWLIRLYQRVAPQRVRDSCRFTPTCSHYALLALDKHGFLTGWRLTWGRLGRCRHPHGGEDYP